MLFFLFKFTMELLENKTTISSLELVKQINIFRAEEREKGSTDRLHANTAHDTLLKIIREEFEEEISLGEINESNYTNERGREYPKFDLTLSQAKQVLVRESKIVRKAVIAYIEKLEQALSAPKPIPAPQSMDEIIIHILQSRVEDRKRLEDVENKLEAITERLAEPEVIALLSVPTPTSRQKVEAIVAGYTKTTKGDYKENWNFLYSKLYLHYRVKIKSMTKDSKQSWLDVAEKAGHCDKLLAVAEKYYRI